MSGDPLSSTLSALADPTRRRLVDALSRGERSVQELAEPFAMSLPAISKHISVLERAGLVTKSRQGQRRICRLRAEPLREVADFAERYRRVWDERLDTLDTYLAELAESEPT